jgi:hypothetical protein
MPEDLHVGCRDAADGAGVTVRMLKRGIVAAHRGREGRFDGFGSSICLVEDSKGKICVFEQASREGTGQQQVVGTSPPHPAGSQDINRGQMPIVTGAEG